MSSDPRKLTIAERLGRDCRGNVAVTTAVFAPVAAMMAALAIDTGAIATQKRALQGHADMAALVAAANLQKAEGAARAYLSDNGRSSIEIPREEGAEEVRSTTGIAMRVETGRYTADRSRPVSERFVAGGEPLNAARVSLSEPQHRLFEFLGRSPKPLDVSGVAVVSAEAGISVGSRLARLEGGIVNGLLSELLGVEIGLSAMSYDALLDVDIDMIDCLEWLADDLELTALTYEDVLSTSIGLEHLLSAMAETASDSALASQALRSLSRDAARNQRTLKVGEIIELGRIAPRALGDPPAGTGVRLEALPLLMASAITANGSNQIDLGLSAQAGRLVDIDASLVIGERPKGQSWFALSGLPGETVSTAHMRLSLTAEIGAGRLLSDALISLPVHIDLASADARVTDIVCEPGEREPKRVNVAVRPSIARLRIADISGSGASERVKPAHILNGRLIQIDAFADIQAANPNDTQLRYMHYEIGGDPKTAGTDRALEGLLSSAITDLHYDIDVIGLQLLSDAHIASILSGLFSELSAPVDRLIFSLTSALGLGLGEADVWVHTASCNAPVLVQ
jgi:uncharacterized membrane protein